jgi:cyclic pyranopterin monophosphate synthase
VSSTKQSGPPLSHVDAANRPTMVDIGDKTTTPRRAVAHSLVVFPAEVAARLHEEAGLTTRKGPIVHTAIIAGVMAVKRTHELIPFCHPLPLDDCKIDIRWQDETSLLIECSVAVTHRTGVEMEALTGASVAALTVYDMCKALSHDIEIRSTRLHSKHGGKRDFTREA